MGRFPLWAVGVRARARLVLGAGVRLVTRLGLLALFPGYVCWSPFAPFGFAFGRHWPGWVVLPFQHFTRPIQRFAIPRAHAFVIVRAGRPVPFIASARARGFQGGASFRGGTGIHRGVFRGGTFRAEGMLRRPAA
jgi:hypothetical protein